MMLIDPNRYPQSECEESLCGEPFHNLLRYFNGMTGFRAVLLLAFLTACGVDGEPIMPGLKATPKGWKTQDGILLTTTGEVQVGVEF